MWWLNNLMFLTTFISNISVSFKASSQYGSQLQTLIKIVRMFYFNEVFIRFLFIFIRVLLLFHRIIPKIFKFIVTNKIKRSVIYFTLVTDKPNRERRFVTEPDEVYCHNYLYLYKRSELIAVTR